MHTIVPLRKIKPGTRMVNPHSPVHSNIIVGAKHGTLYIYIRYTSASLNITLYKYRDDVLVNKKGQP